jgi:hypothetical protein
MPTYLIRAIGFAHGDECPHAGQWLETFDHDAWGGQGEGKFTSDPAKAKQFTSQAKAMEFWRKTSRVRPVRLDGKPNRPLTALTIEVEPMPTKEQDDV